LRRRCGQACHSGAHSHDLNPGYRRVLLYAQEVNVEIRIARDRNSFYDGFVAPDLCENVVIIELQVAFNHHVKQAAAHDGSKRVSFGKVEPHFVLPGRDREIPQQIRACGFIKSLVLED
jgi:hypothetical protein